MGQREEDTVFTSFSGSWHTTTVSLSLFRAGVAEIFQEQTRSSLSTKASNAQGDISVKFLRKRWPAAAESCCISVNCACLQEIISSIGSLLYVSHALYIRDQTSVNLLLCWSDVSWTIKAECFCQTRVVYHKMLCQQEITLLVIVFFKMAHTCVKIKRTKNVLRCLSSVEACTVL